jgi:hypothetical protein
MIVHDENRLLLSDSLRDVLPELDEESLDEMSQAIIVVAMSLFVGDSLHDVFAGKILGFSKDSDVVKLDIYTDLKSAYSVIKKYSTTGLSCRNFYLRLNGDEISFEGRFRVSSSKIFDIDQQVKMCTLGIDLIRERE